MRAIASLALLVSLTPLCGQATPPKSIPWQDSGVTTSERAGARYWRAIATEQRKTEAEAKQAAESEARRMLASSATTQIKQDLVSKQRERTVDGKTRSEEDFSSDLRAVTDHMVKGALTARLDCRREGDAWRGYAEVEIAELDLIPTRRVEAALAEPGTKALLDAAQKLESDGWWPVAERALLLAREREWSGKMTLRLAQFYDRRGDQERAAQLFGTLRDSADAEVATAAKQALAEQAARVPSVEQLARELVEIARKKFAGARLDAQVERAPGKVHVKVLGVPAGHRVMCSWLDDDLRLNYQVSSEGPITMPVSLPLDWPPTGARPTRKARLLLWLLKQDDALWSTLDKVADQDWSLGGEADVARRARLRDLLHALRASNAAACVVDIDG
jgi:hypothetical protein